MFTPPKGLGWSIRVPVPFDCFKMIPWKYFHRSFYLNLIEWFIAGYPWSQWLQIGALRYGSLTRYVKLQVAHAPGMPGTFSPSPQVSDTDMHHGTCLTHVPWCMPGSLTSGFLWIRWREKRSWHSRCMRNSQFYVSVKRPMLYPFCLLLVILCTKCGPLCIGVHWKWIIQMARLQLWSNNRFVYHWQRYFYSMQTHFVVLWKAFQMANCISENFACVHI